METEPQRQTAKAAAALDLFAGVRVRDVAAARSWYERLLGDEPSFFPNDLEAVWALGEQRWLYVLEDPANAGRALVTIMVDDLDGAIADVAGRGLSPTDRETYEGGARKAIYHDPDGNEIALGQLPPGA